MKKRLVIMTIAACAAVAAQAADVSTYVDFASAYVFRGVTLNDGFVMQPGAEISGFPIDEAYGSLAIGIWANYDINDIGNGQEFSEVDYYLSYSLPVEVIDIGLTYTSYTYPGAGGGDSDREISLSFGKDIGTNGLAAAVSFNYGVGGAIENSLYIQGELGYETDLTESLSASAGVTVGYLVSDGGADGFNDATASVGLGYALNDNWSIGAGLTYIAQLDDEVLADSDYDVSLVASVGLSCDF
ncbi:MAG: hypothetical protein ISR84_04105 [Kiritimatiellales bacterium]|nr:hypothetical protein [Kiritimatiellales bacterium]